MAVRAAPELTLPGVPLTEDTEFSRQLYVGPPGSGKTTALAHMAHRGVVVILKAEAGLKVRRLQTLGVPVENIRVLPATCYEDMEAAFWQIKGALEDNPNSVAGVGWDSVSEIQDRFLAIARGQNWEEYLREKEASQEDPEHGEFFTDRSVWGTTAAQLSKLLTFFIDLPCHLVITALPKAMPDESGEGVIWNPAVQPAFQTPLTGKMDTIGHFEAVGTTPEGNELIRGSFRGGGAWNVKDRDGVLPPVLWYPTFDRVLDYVEGRLTVDTDAVQAQFASTDPKPEAPAADITTTTPRRKRKVTDEAAPAAEGEQ